jgi:hypothetical protein
MIHVKCRERIVGKLNEDWEKRLYRYGVIEMAQKIKMPATTLYNKLNGRSFFYEDEIEKIDSEFKKQFEKEAAALAD